MIIFHHINQLGMGGTEKTAGIFADHLRKFGQDAHIISKTDSDLSRLEWFKARKIPVHLYSDLDEYKEIVKEADIVHFHRGGWTEPPCWRKLHSKHTKLVETNVFGFCDNTGVLDLSFYISSATRTDYKNIPCVYLPNPIEPPPFPPPDLANGNDPFIFGRMQRCDENIIVPEPYQIISELEDCQFWITNCEESLDFPNLVKMPTLLDDNIISRFYYVIDLHLAIGSNGHTFGCSIQEAAAHGTPSLIHIASGASCSNAHVEIFNVYDLPEWIVHSQNSMEEWKEKILWAKSELEDEDKKKMWSEKFKGMAKHFAPPLVTGYLLNQYESLNNGS